MNKSVFYVLFGIARVFVGIMNSDAGVYIAVFDMPIDRTLQIGRFGSFRYLRGVYFYVGSAQRNLSARIERHNKKKKKLRWHIDYLSARAEMLGAIIIPGPRELECQLAKKLGNMFKLAVPGFGASDCRCAGHLFYVKDLAKI